MKFLAKISLLVTFLVGGILNTPLLYAQTTTTTSATAATANAAADATYPDKIMACGWGHIDIYDITKGTPNLVWAFTTANSKGYTNCTPYDNNTKILATSVWTGIDIIDTATKTITAHWDAICAHDAVWLPNNRIMLARSTCDTTNADGTTTRHYGGIDIFDGTKPGTSPLSSFSWGGSHFIVLNNDRDNTFWVTNFPHFSLMSVLNVNTPSPFVAKNKIFNSPTYDTGHILHAAAKTPDGKSMIFATENNVYQLDLSTHNVTPYQSEAITNAKSLDFDKNNGLLMYMSPDLQTTTYSGIGFGDGSLIKLPFAKYYRAFWYYGDIPSTSN